MDGWKLPDKSRRHLQLFYVLNINIRNKLYVWNEKYGCMNYLELLIDSSTVTEKPWFEYLSYAVHECMPTYPLRETVMRTSGTEELKKPFGTDLSEFRKTIGSRSETIWKQNECRSSSYKGMTWKGRFYLVYNQQRKIIHLGWTNFVRI